MTSEQKGVDVQVVTRMIPDDSAAYEKGDTVPRPFTGFDVGPFFVHSATSDDELLYVSNEAEEGCCWHVTHRACGFAAQKAIETHARAIWLAKELSQFDCWGGTTKDEILAGIPADMLAQIKRLRDGSLDRYWPNFDEDDQP